MTPDYDIKHNAKYANLDDIDEEIEHVQNALDKIGLAAVQKAGDQLNGNIHK